MPAPDVCLVGPFPAPGTRHEGWTGVASYTANLAGALSDEGARVAVVAPREPGIPDAHREGAVLVQRAFTRGVRAVPDALRAARRTGAPVVHLQHETFLYGGPDHLPGLVGALASLRCRPTRSVVTMHHVVDPSTVDADFARMHRVRAPVAAIRAGLGGMSTAIRRLADEVIVHEPAFTESVPGSTVVPHGIEVDAAATPRDAATLDAFGLDPDRLTVLCFGFLAPYKGLEAVLEAGRLASDAVQVVVAGGEHPRLQRATTRSYGDELRTAHGDHAQFTGFVADDYVGALFGAADVAVFPYPRPMAASGALALALAHRTPALVSPELARTIQAPHGLIAPRDPALLAERLRALHEDRAALVRLGTETAVLAAGRSWPAVARRHIAVYGGGA